jgi:hypothetical protein
VSLFGDIPIPDECYYVELPVYNDVSGYIPSSNGNTGQWQVFSYGMPWYGRLAYTGYLAFSSSGGVVDCTCNIGSNTSPSFSGAWAGRVSDYDEAGFWATVPLLSFWDNVAKGTVVNLWTYATTTYNSDATVRLQYMNGSLRASRI